MQEVISKQEKDKTMPLAELFRSSNDKTDLRGETVSRLLLSQAECERKLSDTPIQSFNMIPLDSEEWKGQEEAKKDYKKNIEVMTKNINALVRIFSDKAMRDKLLKNFASARQESEIKIYNETFDKLHMLWTYKLC